METLARAWIKSSSQEHRSQEHATAGLLQDEDAKEVDYGADNCWGYGCFAEEPEKAY
jgi:hypothetical protein